VLIDSLLTQASPFKLTARASTNTCAAEEWYSKSSHLVSAF